MSLITEVASTQYWPAVKAGIILMATFLIARIANYLLARWSRRYVKSLKSREKFTAVTTRMEVFRRVAGVFVWFIGIIVLVFQFPAARSLGVGLFASAGAVGLVLGLAAQNTLSNIIAGIVLSFS
ncbi:mechanosensitive ion channel family protein [Candidatus Bipolaricaulota bacterium]|nr:mechanosensitive ion channel family protein [Candidatus Bipolaricaulota bacterium]